MNATTKPAVKHVAEICLYGAQHCGYGWLATDCNGKMMGDGELDYTSLTEAVWAARDYLLKDAASKGGPATLARTVRIFCTGGERYVDVKFGSIRYFGDLTGWQPAGGYVISAEAIEAAAVKA